MFEHNGTLYFKGIEAINTGSNSDYLYRSGPLFYTDNGFYLINARSKPIHYTSGQVQIYNQITRAYEPLEIEHFREIDEYFYTYKNALYGYEVPVFHNSSNINYDQLQRIAYSYFYTDGRIVFYNADSRIKIPSLDYAREFHPIAPGLIIEGVDLDSVQVINEYMLIDAKNIYTIAQVYIDQQSQYRIQTISRGQLGFEVLVFGATPFKQ